MIVQTPTLRHYLLASDFDQTLSFNDSGLVLSELIGVADFEEKVAGLARSNLVQQGGELAYLIRHDPAFRGIRREHLEEAGRRVRLKEDIRALVEFLARGIDGYRFSFFVISAAPRELVQSALAGIVEPEHIFGTEFDYDDATGEVRAIRRVPAGYGKVAVIEELEERLGIGPDRTIYVGDGSSDVHVMLHVNNRDGFTIAVSENQHLARIATRIVLSDNAFSILVPVLEQIVGRRPAEIRALFEANRLRLHEWERARTDRITVREAAPAAEATPVRPQAGAGAGEVVTVPAAAPGAEVTASVAGTADAAAPADEAAAPATPSRDDVTAAAAPAEEATAPATPSRDEVTAGQRGGAA